MKYLMLDFERLVFFRILLIREGIVVMVKLIRFGLFMYRLFV